MQPMQQSAERRKQLHRGGTVSLLPVANSSCGVPALGVSGGGAMKAGGGRVMGWGRPGEGSGAAASAGRKGGYGKGGLQGPGMEVGVKVERNGEAAAGHV